MAKCAILIDTCVTQNNSALKLSVMTLASRFILVSTVVANRAEKVKVFFQVFILSVLSGNLLFV